MGIAGTKVAQNAAEITVLDDNFATIVEAIKWGRNVYDAISKFLVFQLTVNIVAVILVLGCACIAGATPLGALQLLWVNMIMDTLASLALATEDPRDKLMQREPYAKAASVVSKPMLRQMLGHSFYQLVIMFLLCFDGHRWFDIEYGLKPEEDCEEGDHGLTHLTIIFNTFVWMQLFNEINSRRIDSERNVFESLHENGWFLGIMVVQIAGQALITEFGSAAFKLSSDGLNGEQWLVCLGLGVSELLWHQLLLCVDYELIPQWMVDIFVVDLPEEEEEEEEKTTSSERDIEGGPTHPRAGTMESIHSIKQAASLAAEPEVAMRTRAGSTSSMGSSKPHSRWGLVTFVVTSKRAEAEKKKYWKSQAKTSMREVVLQAVAAAAAGKLASGTNEALANQVVNEFIDKDRLTDEQVTALAKPPAEGGAAAAGPATVPMPVTEEKKVGSVIVKASVV